MNDLIKRAKTKKILDILADYFRVYTDEELAIKLGSTRTSIAQWRFTNQVPKKIIDRYVDQTKLWINQLTIDMQSRGMHELIKDKQQRSSDHNRKK